MQDRLPRLLAEVFEKAPRCSRKSILELVIRHIGQQRSKFPESGVGEDGATDRKADCDAKKLSEEHESDAVCHVLHLYDSQNHGETGLQVAANANAQEDLKSVKIGVACRGVDLLEHQAADEDADCSEQIPGLIKRVDWKQGALQRNEHRRSHNERQEPHSGVQRTGSADELEDERDVILMSINSRTIQERGVVDLLCYLPCQSCWRSCLWPSRRKEGRALSAKSTGQAKYDPRSWS